MVGSAHNFARNHTLHTAASIPTPSPVLLVQKPQVLLLSLEMLATRLSPLLDADKDTPSQIAKPTVQVTFTRLT